MASALADMSAPAAEFNFMKTKVVKPHHATDETQLELQLDDIVYVLEQDDSGWWGGHKEGQDCTGWFPGSCVRETDDQDDQPADEPCDAWPSGAPLSPEPRDPISSVCREGLDLDAQDPLYRDNRMVASPNRRVSAGNVAPSIDSATVLANLQEEYRDAKEQHAREIQLLQDQLSDANANAKRAVNARKRTEEDLQSQCRSLKKDKEELQKRVQDLTTKLEDRSSSQKSVEAQRAEALQQQLTKSQQESRNSINECDQLRRRLQEKESELLRAKETARPLKESVQEASLKDLPKRPVVEGELPRASPSPRCAENKTPPLGDDARRRLFPSTADASLAGMPATEKDLPHSILNVTAEDPFEVSNVSNTMETVPCLSERITAFNAFRQPPQPPAGGRQTPAGSAPRPGRSNSLTRPAFRPSPSASPSMHLSPGGMAKCVSTGILPDTPSRIDAMSEIPPVGSVKEMARLFEQRCSTPDGTRNEGGRPATDGDLSSRLAPLRSHRSPVTEQRLRENPNSARSLPRQPVKTDEAIPRVQNLTGLDMKEVEDGADFQVNFNMSPMKRNA